MISNWVRETVSGGGTGNLTLSGATSGSIQFSDFFITKQNFWYTIEDGNDREIGIGHMTTATNLVRDKVVETLVLGTYDKTAPAATNVSTSAEVMVTACAQTSSASSAGIVNGTSRGIVHPGYDTNLEANFGIRDQTLTVQAFHVGHSASIDAVGVNVGAAAATDLHFGIYTVGTDGLPFQQLTAITPTTVSTTGYKVFSFTEILLHPGWYYLCYLTDHATNSLSLTSSSTSVDSLGGNGSSAKLHAVMRKDGITTSLITDLSGTSYSIESDTLWPKFFLQVV